MLAQNDQNEGEAFDVNGLKDKAIEAGANAGAEAAKAAAEAAARIDEKDKQAMKDQV